ncbi:RecQ helicase TLH3 [Akanthomyces lecanii RCEF 1005]|uniref:RecQ helicase TLH3 n=1 Tax=Akanthomyces lecanii RCEF 1005 TaxID=1081108 RepID=A0A162ITU4_CORDF|nr:RecQ helicase TLH3 [Akanthomyces lecanii RCEF 1005]
MHPFIHDPEFPFLFCGPCRWAIVRAEAASHLNKHHSDIPVIDRKAITQAIEEVPDVVDTQSELTEYELPDRKAAIPHVHPPKVDGLRCRACPYVVRTVRGMQQHCREQHGWVNDWRRGRRARLNVPSARQLPWTGDVHCQRLFAGGPASHWFEVQKATEREEQDSVVSNSNTDAQDNIHAFEHMMHDMGTKFQAMAANEKIKEDDQKREANAWLGRVGWAQHLEGLYPKTLFEMGNPATEDEPVLQQLCGSIERVMEAAKRVCHRRHVGLATMFEINRREASKRASRPFDARMESDSWTRYKETWTHIIRIIYRAEQVEDEKRPPYVMTEEQGDAWDAWESSAQARSQAAISQVRRQAQARQRYIGS